MKNRRTTILSVALLTASPLSLIAAATPAIAQEKSYDIPAQPLASAILEYSRQSNVAVLAPMALVKGKQAPAVRGNLSSTEALDRLLAGSGLRAVRGANGGMSLVRASAPGNASGAASSGAQQGQAVLAGSVRDHATGSALKGARIEVVETGDTTSTGDLGDFRFARLPSGDVTLRVSYLGFPEQTETVSVVGGFANRTDIYLGQGATSEIVVYGQVSARAQALNQERTAENSTTVISGDLLGNFNGTTISDSLRRAPGVSFQQDPGTGDGSNVIVRGLAPDYNQVKLNGLALPDSSGIGRSPNLNNILSDSVSEIKISKTLLASQDSSGTGGLIEIETKSPLDRPKRYFNVSAEGTKYGKGFGDEYLLSGTASMRFGASGNFGVSASLQYRKQDIATYSYSADGVFGEYLPLLPNGNPATPETLDPRTPFPFYDGAEYMVRAGVVTAANTDVSTRTLGLAAEWQLSEGTNWRLDYVNSRRKDERFSNRYELSPFGAGYALAPVPELGGALRYVYLDGIYSGGVGELNARSFTSLDQSSSVTNSISFRGTSAFGPFSVSYVAGYSRGASKVPINATLNLVGFPGLTVNDENFLPSVFFDPATGAVGSHFGPRVGRGIPAPLLTPLGFERLRTQPLSLLQGYSAALDSSGRSTNWSGELNAKYEFGSGILKYIEAGATYRRSSFSSRSASSLGYTPIYDETGFPVPLDQIGVEFEDLPFSTSAGDQLYRLVTRSSFENLLTRLDDYTADGLLTRYGPEAPDPLFDGQGTSEDALAGFIQTRVDIGKLEIIAGIRLDRTRVDARFVNGDSIFDENFNIDLAFFNSTRRIIEDSDTLTTVLPRILVNFRPQENIVLRAGYYSTVARPQIQQLNSAKSLVYYAAPIFGPTATQPLLAISAGNPGLKPAWTHNFDLSAEWYDGRVGVLKLSAFYKRIDNLIESNSIFGSDALGDYELPDHPALANLPANTLISLSSPINNPDPATVWGFEAAVERQLSFLPGVLSGLGVYANYVYSRSRKTQSIAWLAPIFDNDGNVIGSENVTYELKLPFNQSPRHSGTVGLTYTRPGFDASLYYTQQARRQTNGGVAYGMDIYNEALNTLDFRAVYSFKLAGRDIRFSFEGKDLLKGRSDANIETSIGGVRDAPKYYTAGNFFGGRKFTLGLSATF